MKKAIVFVLAAGVLITGCSNSENRAKGVYMLIDTSGKTSVELKKSQLIISYLLGTLQTKDTLAVASIDTASFNEKDIIAKVTFDRRPSVANNQKRVFHQEVNNFISSVKSSRYTDISGGILHAVEYLNETASGKKYILIFSELKEELAKNHIRDMPFQLDGFEVVAFNVTELGQGFRNSDTQLKRVENWRVKIENGQGKWWFISDLESLGKIFTD